MLLRAPGFGDTSVSDIGRYCHLDRWNPVITEDLGLELKDATIEALGQAAKVSVDKDSTVCRRCGNPEAIANRVAVISLKLEAAASEFDRENSKSNG